MTGARPELVTTHTLRSWALPAPGDGKEARGRVLVVGGSRETPGSLVLAGEAALRVGADPAGSTWAVQGGGPGLGVSGSGDVQSGIVAGLLARGATPAQAAVWGGHLHGRAGDALAVSVGEMGFLARELPGCLPGLLAQLG